MRHIDEIRRDLSGFAMPKCEACGVLSEPQLDDDGVYCARCGDEIPNGGEFDAVVEELRVAKAQSPLHRCQPISEDL